MPALTGAIIDAVTNGDGAAFRASLALLLAASAASAVFTGLRGWALSIALARLKIRLRDRLFRALLCAETGFFDTTSVGALTSRLSSDTTVVGDSLSLNVNVLARSLIAIAGSLAFMLSISLRLTL